MIYKPYIFINKKQNITANVCNKYVLYLYDY